MVTAGNKAKRLSSVNHTTKTTHHHHHHHHHLRHHHYFSDYDEVKVQIRFKNKDFNKLTECYHISLAATML